MRWLAVLLTVSLACKGDKNEAKPSPPPPPPPAPADAAVVSETQKHVEPPKPIELPKSPDTPPTKTTKPLDRPALEKLAAIEFGSFVKIQRGFTDKFLEVRHVTKDRPKLGVMVTIQPCEKAKPCVPIDLAKWKAKGDELKQFLSPDLKKRPDTTFEVGLTDIGGAKAFHTYQSGLFVGQDENKNPIGDYTDAYVLYYNDGVNQIRVNAHYLDDSPGTLKAMLDMAPQEDLERLAVAFLKYYVHQW